MHFESMDEKHSAFCRHLCDEALRRQSTVPGERQGTDAALSALLKEMTDYFDSSSPGNLASSRKTAASLPSGVHDSPHILEVVGSAGRWYPEEEQKRMRWDPEEIEGVTLPQVQNDPVLKRNCASNFCPSSVSPVIDNTRAGTARRQKNSLKQCGIRKRWKQ